MKPLPILAENSEKQKLNPSRCLTPHSASHYRMKYFVQTDWKKTSEKFKIQICKFKDICKHMNIDINVHDAKKHTSRLLKLE